MVYDLINCLQMVTAIILEYFLEVYLVDGKFINIDKLQSFGTGNFKKGRNHKSIVKQVIILSEEEVICKKSVKR